MNFGAPDNGHLYAESICRHGALFHKEFEANIGDFKEVQSCYCIAGSFRFLFAVDVVDMDAYHEFIPR